MSSKLLFRSFLFGTFFSLFSLVSCSQTAKVNSADGEVVSSTGIQTFQAKYNGREHLKVGDKVKIIEYQNFSEDLKERESRNFPFMADKRTQKVIGQASVSHVLDDNYYEFTTDRPQHVPEDALIQKL